MRKFAVIGLGRFGGALARNLVQRGAEVIALDKDSKLIDEIKEEVTLAVRLDSTDEEALRSQGIDQIDVAIVSIGNFEDSVLTTALLKRLKVRTVITRASRTTSRIQERILKLIGADKVVLPEVEMGKKLAQSLSISNVLDCVSISDKYSAAEVYSPGSFQGKTIEKLEIREKYKVTILQIKKTSMEGGKAKVRKINYFPQSSDIIEKGDILLVAGEEKDVERFSQQK